MSRRKALNLLNYSALPLSWARLETTMSFKAASDPNRKNNPLTPQQLKFCEEYVKTMKANNGSGNGKEAAIAAGYSEKGAARQAHLLLNYNSEVKAYMAKIRNRAEAKGLYSLEMAMREADEAIDFAIATNNANARVKALELKMKLHGLLIEKHHVQQGGQFSINIVPFPGAPIPIQAVDVTPSLPELLPSEEPKHEQAEEKSHLPSTGSGSSEVS